MAKQYQTRSEVHKKERRKGGMIRNIIGVLLIVFAIALLALDPLKNRMIENVANQNSINNISREQIVSNQDADVNYDFGVIEPLTSWSVLANQSQSDSFPVIGWVAIPEVGMNLPIHKGVDNAGMFFGAGTLSQEQVMGENNYSLASHHSINKDLLFAPLMRVELGDTIYLTDLENVYQYEVDYAEPVPSTAVDLIYPIDDEEQPIVTLLTCDAELIDHIAVRGTLTQVVPIDEADDAMLAAFSIEQTVPE